LTGFEPHHSDNNFGMLFSLFSTVSSASFLQKLSAQQNFKSSET